MRWWDRKKNKCFDKLKLNWGSRKINRSKSRNSNYTDGTGWLCNPTRGFTDEESRFSTTTAAAKTIIIIFARLRMMDWINWTQSNNMYKCMWWPSNDLISFISSSDLDTLINCELWRKNPYPATNFMFTLCAMQKIRIRINLQRHQFVMLLLCHRREEVQSTSNYVHSIPFNSFFCFFLNKYK